MANNNSDSGKYWPYLILGFISIGLFLGFWTVRSAISMPVSDSDEYQKKYQDADVGINQILESQARFDARYRLEPVGFALSSFKPKVYAKKNGALVAVSHTNIFKYRITDTRGNAINDANLSLLITRPQTNKEDQTFINFTVANGVYSSPKIILKNPGRYVLRLQTKIGDAVGHLQQEAYLNP